MRIAKLKTAALVGAAAIMLTGTSLVTYKVVGQSVAAATVDDSAWMRITVPNLNALPPAFVLRPTHFSRPDRTRQGGLGGGGGWGGDGRGILVSGDKMIGKAITFDELMSLAYGVDPVPAVTLHGEPINRFDLLLTSPDATKEKLQQEIKKRYGIVGRLEDRLDVVYVLTVKQTNAPGLMPAGAHDPRDSSISGGPNFAGANAGGLNVGGANEVHGFRMAMGNARFNNLIDNLQLNPYSSLDKPIIDRTELTGNYDLNLNVVMAQGETKTDAIIRSFRDQLGLDLELNTDPISVVVIEKAK
jgi:uncharacterized protein (TIGR03435 family)